MAILSILPSAARPSNCRHGPSPRRYSDASSVHVKPSAKNKHGGLVGDSDDDLKWPEIFKACETVGGTEWYIVEYDGGSMEKAEKTIELLRKWGKL